MLIGIISDTHSHMDERILHHLAPCDEVWHAGDFGNTEVSDRIAAQNKLRAVYGNIDGQEIRQIHPEEQFFEIGGMQVYMTHIAGYPGTYKPWVKERINTLHPDIVVTGHSHITKALRDPKTKHLHLNPGAAGFHGFHKVRTIMLLEIASGKAQNLKVIELGSRGKIAST